MPAIGPEGQRFLDEALPGSEGGHLLAVGEKHDLTAQKDWMREHLAELKADHNLGTIGLEMGSFMNVFLWAYKDGKLPVAPGKEAEYMQSMFMAYSSTRFNTSVAAEATLSMEAINQGVEVFAYDARHTLADQKASNFDEINEIQSHPEWIERFHEEPSQIAKLPRHCYQRLCCAIVRLPVIRRGISWTSVYILYHLSFSA